MNDMIDALKLALATQVKKVFKNEAGKPIGEIGIDLEASPGNGPWYVKHYASEYDVVGFDDADEAEQELAYVIKHYPVQEIFVQKCVSERKFYR